MRTSEEIRKLADRVAAPQFHLREHPCPVTKLSVDLNDAAALLRTLAEVQGGLKVLLTATRKDEYSEWWSVRKWLDDRDIFNDDLSEERLTALVCTQLLALLEAR